MQLLSIRKEMLAVTHAKTGRKLTRLKNKKQNTHSPSAAGKKSRQLPPSWRLARQLPEGAVGPRLTLPALLPHHFWAGTGARKCREKITFKNLKRRQPGTLQSPSNSEMGFT